MYRKEYVPPTEEDILFSYKKYLKECEDDVWLDDDEVESYDEHKKWYLYNKEEDFVNDCIEHTCPCCGSSNSKHESIRGGSPEYPVDFGFIHCLDCGVLRKTLD